MKKQSYCSYGVLRGMKVSKALNTLTLRTLNLLKTPSGGIGDGDQSSLSALSWVNIRPRSCSNWDCFSEFTEK